MNVIQEIEILPVMLLEALINHDFFSATYIKKHKQEIEDWINMNGGRSKYEDYKQDE